MEGLRIGIPAARKGRELADAFERTGATAIWGPTLATVPPETDALLAAETQQVVASRPTWVLVSTASGLTAWVAAAEQAGMTAELTQVLKDAHVVARGAKGHGALRSMGIEPTFVSNQETMSDLCDWLADHVDDRDHLAVQVHGGEVIGALDQLRAKVASTVTVSPYRWVLPDDLTPAEELVRELVAGTIDVLAATSAPAVRNLMLIAGGLGLANAVVTALRDQVCVAAVGPVTARAFEELGVPVAVMPRRSRSGDLVRSVTHWADLRQDAPGQEQRGTGPLRLVPGASAVRIGATVVVLGRQEFALLAALVRRPGVVVSPATIVTEAWGHRAPDDLAAVRLQVARIRRKLGAHASCLQTVRSVGYRYCPEALA